MSGSKILKITGIIMIVGGALAIFLSLLGFLGIATLAALGGNVFILFLVPLVGLATGVIQLLAGLKGYKGYDNPEIADTCLKWGIAIIGLSLIGTILSFIATGSLDFKNLAIGLILPGLYTYGAYQVKQGDFEKRDL